MEKEQIVKALKCCANYQKFGDCDKCPAREGCDAEDNFLEREALSLILEQDKRIEELETACTELTQCCTKLETIYKLACKRADTTKADTVRKYREKLYREFASLGSKDKFNKEFFLTKVDKIAKQLTVEKA